MDETAMPQIVRDAFDELDRLKKDARRYRKLKGLAEDPYRWDNFDWLKDKFDAAVDALPDPDAAT